MSEAERSAAASRLRQYFARCAPHLECFVRVNPACICPRCDIDRLVGAAPQAPLDADPVAAVAKTFTLMPRYRTGGYGAMVESEHGQWVKAKDVEDLLEDARPEYRRADEVSETPERGDQ